MKILIALIIFCIPFNAISDDNLNWQDIDRVGLSTFDKKEQIIKDPWDDYSQSEAIELLNNLPDKLQSSSYRNVIRNILLSNSDKHKDDITSPALLTKRLSLLIEYGLFKDANELYDQVTKEDMPSGDLDLSLIGITLSMINGGLSNACLDIEVLSSKFRDMPAWRELSKFCKVRFKSHEKVNISELSFKFFPFLKDILISDNIQLAPDLNEFKSILAFSDNKISKSDYNKSSKNTSQLSDLVITLATKSNFKEYETFQCYAIEAVKRGIRDIDFLASAYKDIVFDENILNNTGGKITLHPCNIPAFFYQRLKQDGTEAEKTKTVELMLDVTKSIPAIALTPMTDQIEKFTTKSNHWKASIILGMAEKNIPDHFLPTSMPIKNMTESNHMSQKDYKKWLEEEDNSKIINNLNIDKALPLYILSIVSGDYNKLDRKTQKNRYENFFSLTYVKNPISLGIGFNNFIAKSYLKRDKIKTLVNVISVLGEYKPSDIHENDIAVILSALKAYKLEKNAITLGLEYLQ